MSGKYENALDFDRILHCSPSHLTCLCQKQKCPCNQPQCSPEKLRVITELCASVHLFQCCHKVLCWLWPLQLNIFKNCEHFPHPTLVNVILEYEIIIFKMFCPCNLPTLQFECPLKSSNWKFEELEVTKNRPCMRLVFAQNFSQFSPFKVDI